MTELIHDISNAAITVRRDGLHCRPQVVSQIGRHSDPLPIEFGIPIFEPLAFDCGEVWIRHQQVEPFDQELMSFHQAELAFGVETRGVLVPRVGECCFVVPVKAGCVDDDFRLSEDLTSRKQFVKFVALILACASLASGDGRCGRRSSASQRGCPVVLSRPRDFSVESLSLSGRTRQFFSPEKSLRCEVDDDHRT